MRASPQTRRHVLGGLGGAMCGWALRPAWAAFPRPTPDAFITFFEQIALTYVRRSGAVVPGRVRKWSGPGRAQLRGGPGVDQGQAMRAILADISAWTRLPFETGWSTGGAGAGKITIYSLSGREMRQLRGAQGSICRTRTITERGDISGARVEIADTHADCLAHEFMHVLGFPNHWYPAQMGIDAPSVLARRSAPQRTATFSPWDALAIRVLYDDRLKPWTRRDDALPIVKQVVDELLVA